MCAGYVCGHRKSASKPPDGYCVYTTEPPVKLGSLQPYRLTTPVALEVGFKLTIDAERAAFVPGVTRSDAHNVKGTFRDMIEITKLLQVLTSLELL